MGKPPDHAVFHPSESRKQFYVAAGSGLVLMLGLRILTIPANSDHTTGELIRRQAPAVADTETESPGGSDESYRRLMLGKWERQLFGERTLTVRADGTATAVFDPSEIWSLVFGNRLTLELDWKVERGYAIYQIRTGSPAMEFERAKKQFGERWNEKILELNEERLLLLDGDGVSKSLWKRVSE